MPKVVSSNVAEVDYDKEKKALTVIFHSGARYVYGGVPTQTYTALLNSPSVGSFVHRVLKQYPVIEAAAAGAGPKKKR